MICTSVCIGFYLFMESRKWSRYDGDAKFTHQFFVLHSTSYKTKILRLDRTEQNMHFRMQPSSLPATSNNNDSLAPMHIHG